MAGFITWLLRLAGFLSALSLAGIVLVITEADYNIIVVSIIDIGLWLPSEIK